MNVRRAFAVVVYFLAVLGVRDAYAAPVEFSFSLAPVEGNPFAREIWAEVQTPKGRTLRVPAFLHSAGTWSVRIRSTEPGTYRLGSVSETTKAHAGFAVLEARAIGKSAIDTAQGADARGIIRVDPRDARRFAFANGEFYFPLGGNLPWPQGRSGRDAYYPRAFRTFHDAGLNWARLWMAHWGGMNLDWLPGDVGKSPSPGELSFAVAARWDTIINAAEQNGVFIQLVLQHHGQYSTTTNSNWTENPWNAANGGFLKTPDEFFTSQIARDLTKLKYRTIVARWGYSPAIMAWELFNEVMWTDARHRNEPVRDNDAVAAWHSEMAAYIRSIDVEHHLVTTSDEALVHPLYAAMDFLQPHIYAADMLASVRAFDPLPPAPARPFFYGEFGDENSPDISARQRDQCLAIAPIVWASLMGDSAQPAQVWEAQKVIDRGRISELGAIARFARASGLDRDGALAPFSPHVECATTVPLMLRGAQSWKRMAPPTVRLPLDGSEPAALGSMPRHFAKTNAERPDGFPPSATILLDAPAASTARITFSDVARNGATARILVDGNETATFTWPALPDTENKNAPRPPPRPAEITFPLSPGAHSVVIENRDGPGWFELNSFEPGVSTSIIAAIGKRSATRAVLWLWHRDGWMVGAAPVAASVVLDDLPAGTWRVTWWDSIAGKATAPTDVKHNGGTLSLPTPSIARHAAVVLERR